MSSFLQSFLRPKAKTLITTLKKSLRLVKREKKENQSLLKTQVLDENSLVLPVTKFSLRLEKF